MTNEVGDTVPLVVIEAASHRGCHGGCRYVYREGQYGSKFPAASIGGSKATRFRSRSYEAFKIVIAPGWVAFASPSAETPRIDKSSKNSILKSNTEGGIIFSQSDVNAGLCNFVSVNSLGVSEAQLEL